LAQFRTGIDRVSRESSAFFETLGYKHIEGTGLYEVIRDNNDRVALFAHGGFGVVFLSVLLDIPYPDFSANFEIGHTGVTVIEFEECEGICHPRIISFSNDGHLYREGLPTKFNGRVIY
jgi:probable phosphoglycerate mutase